MKISMLAVLTASIAAVPLATACAQPMTAEQRQEVEWNRTCLARQGNVPVSEAVQTCVREYRLEHQTASPAPVRQETPQQVAYALCISRIVEQTELRGLPQLWGLPESGPHITDIRPGPAFPDPAVGPNGARCYVTVTLSQPSGLFPPVMVGAVVVRLLQHGDVEIRWSPR